VLKVSRLPREVTERQLAGLCGAAARLPTAVATGAFDRMSPAGRASQLAADLGAASPTILPECGHLSHEEAPEVGPAVQSCSVSLIAPYVLLVNRPLIGHLVSDAQGVAHVRCGQLC